jgi:hypothetical protein
MQSPCECPAGDHLLVGKGEYELRRISLGAVIFGGGPGGAPAAHAEEYIDVLRRAMPQVALILASQHLNSLGFIIFVRALQRNRSLAARCEKSIKVDNNCKGGESAP